MVLDFPYEPDSSRLFEALADAEWAVFLDSGQPLGTTGRFDILSAEPHTTLVTRGPLTEIHDRVRGHRQVSREDPLTLLDAALGPRQSALPELPFQGGAIGYFAYDLARRLVPLPSLAHDAEGIPELAVGLYDWALVVDHRRQCATLVGRDPEAAREWATRLRQTLDRPDAPPPRRFRVRGAIRSNLGREAYLGALARIREYLLAGDCYQVNFAQRFAVPAEGDAWALYRRLRRINAAPFGAYLATPDCRILCSSPERFLHCHQDQVETQPIKGTRPRGQDAAQDRRLAEELRHSPKDRAENLMIVDLLRNDLGKVCAIGSVTVPRLFEVERFARVQHLVSTVRGRLAAGRSPLDLLRAAFPGGSITGAPKRRAMAIIEELEPHRRGVYCGAIGYLSADGRMDTTIAIRTLVHSHGMARLWAGGGIVADSDPEAEYQETLDKAAPLLEVLEQARLDRTDT